MTTILQSYRNSLTIHGLPRVLNTGTTTQERVAWGVIVMVSVAGAILMTKSLWTEYSSNSISTVIKVNALSSMELPNITVCHHGRMKTLDNLAHLFKNYSQPLHISKSEYDDCKKANFSCMGTSAFIFKSRAKEMILGKFRFTDIPQVVYRPVGASQACVSFSGFKQENEETALDLWIVPRSIRSTKLLRMYINPATESFFRSKAIYTYIQPGYLKTILLKKRLIKRLPAPYSNCVMDKNESNNIFGGDYTLNKCKLTSLLRETTTNCGISMYAFQSYIPKE